MKVVLKNIILYISFMIFCAGTVDAFGQIMQTQPVLTILQTLKNNGYVAVKRIELAQDEYQVQALDNDGNQVDIRINSHSGEIIAMEKIDSHISMLEVVEKVEAVGYAGVSYIEAKNNHYDIIALSPSGKKTHLRVDAFTGQITKELF